MKLTLTSGEILSQWRQRGAIDPDRTDCTVTPEYDGLDLDSLLRARIDQWYEQLLLEAPVRYLYVEDISANVVPQGLTCGTGRPARYNVLPDVVRLVSVTWPDDEAAYICDLRRAETLAALPRRLHAACNPYVADPCRMPLALLSTDGKTLEIYGRPDGAAPICRAVTRPTVGSYVMDSTALTLMPIISE